MKNIFDRSVLANIPEVKNWLGMYARNSQDTIKRVEKEICVFFNVMDFKTIKDVEEFKVEDIYKLYELSSELKWSNNTTNSYIETAKLFYRWANYNNIIKQNNSVFGIKRLKNDAEPKYCPSEEEMKTIMQTIKKHTKNNRMFVMVKLCIYSGLRRKEICNLKISDIIGNQIRIVGKGSKIRMQTINSEVIEDIQNYIKTERKQNMEKYIQMGGKDLGYIFVSGINDIENHKKRPKNLENGNKIDPNSFYNQIKNMCNKVPIKNSEKISPHTLRHYFGTSVYDKTLDLALTQEAMRHSDMATTRRYVHLNKQRLEDALTSISI